MSKVNVTDLIGNYLKILKSIADRTKWPCQPCV